MSPLQEVAPQVTLYLAGSPPPPVRPGAIALAQLAPLAGQPAVFGDGSHPTTRLCAAALDLLCRRRPAAAVLDVGTGTGLLARIARARAARRVAGTDIDPTALECARANAALDAHPLGIHFGAEAPGHWGACFDLVVSNILEAPLRELAPALARALAPGGILLLCGFTRLQVPAVRVAYEQAGLSCSGCSRLDEWALLKLVRESVRER
jgi:ribosomal protein L11 methyltransferase